MINDASGVKVVQVNKEINMDPTMGRSGNSEAIHAIVNPNDKCGIKSSLIMDNLTALQKMVSDTHGDKQKLVDVILNDVFYNRIHDLATIAASIKASTVVCMGAKKEDICNKNNLHALTLTDLENTIKIIDRYTPLLRELYTNIKDNVKDYAAYCGQDMEKINQIGTMVKKLGEVLTDNKDMKTVDKTALMKDKKVEGFGAVTSISCGSVMLIIFILIMVGYLMWFKY